MGRCVKRYISFQAKNGGECCSKENSGESLITYWEFANHRMFKRVWVHSMVQAILFWSKAGTHQLHPSSIALATTMIYMLNSIVSRPVDMPAEKMIHECITNGCWDITITPGENGQRDVEHKRYLYGLLFPADVVCWSEQIECPHLGLGLNMPEAIYPRLFWKKDLYLIQGMLLAAVEPTRVRQRLMDKRITIKGPRSVLPHAGPIDQEDIINLEPLDVRFIPTIQDNNGNVEAAVTSMNTRVSETLARFYMDVLSRAPNQGRSSTSPPYCLLDMAACKAATAATFQEQNLAKIWIKVIVRPATRDAWDRNFDNLFPRKADVVEEDQRKANGMKSTRQGYEQCPYYTGWCAILRTLEVETTETLRAAIKVSALNHP